MSILALIVFGLHVIMVVAGAILAVWSSNLVRALMGLIMTLFGVAGMYFLMAAPFIALMQILIYVGAVSVLIFFAIMLTRAWSGGDEAVDSAPRRTVFAGLAALAPAVFLGLTIVMKAPPSNPQAAETSVKELGHMLLDPFILPFELISLLLTVVMAGAVLLAFERRVKK